VKAEDGLHDRSYQSPPSVHNVLHAPLFLEWESFGTGRSCSGKRTGKGRFVYVRDQLDLDPLGRMSVSVTMFAAPSSSPSPEDEGTRSPWRRARRRSKGGSARGGLPLRGDRVQRQRAVSIGDHSPDGVDLEV
jgi:hypothetical protein